MAKREVWQGRVRVDLNGAPEIVIYEGTYNEVVTAVYELATKLHEHPSFANPDVPILGQMATHRASHTKDEPFELGGYGFIFRVGRKDADA